MRNLKTAGLITACLLLISCEYYDRDFPAFLEYYTGEASIKKHELPPGSISKTSAYNKHGIDCVRPGTNIKFHLENPQRYDLITSSDNTYLTSSYFSQSKNKKILNYTVPSEKGTHVNGTIILKAKLKDSDKYRPLHHPYSVSFLCDTQPPEVGNPKICYKDNEDETRTYYLCFTDTVKDKEEFSNVNQLCINNNYYTYGNLPADRFFTELPDVTLYPFGDDEKKNPFVPDKNQMYYLLQDNIDDNSDESYTAYIHYEDPYLKGKTSAASVAYKNLSAIKWSKSGGLNISYPYTLSLENNTSVTITLQQNENAEIHVTVKNCISNEETSYSNKGSLDINLEEGVYSLKAFAKKKGYITTEPKEYFYKAMDAIYVSQNGKNNNHGTKLSPYNSIKNALKSIDKTSTSDVLIYVLDDLTDLTESANPIESTESTSSPESPASTDSAESPASIKIDTNIKGGDIYIEGYEGNKNITFSERNGINENCFDINGKNVFMKNLTLTGFELKSHQDGKGGGVYLQNGNLTMENCTITGSKAGGEGGAIYSEAGTSVTLRNCKINNCDAINYGGAIYSLGNLTIEDSVISKCFSNSGGSGIHVENSDFILKNTCIQECKCIVDAGVGGGLFLFNVNCYIEGTTSISNCVANRGSGIWLEGASTLNIKDNAKILSGDLYMIKSNAGQYPSINISETLKGNEKIAYIRFYDYKDYISSYKVITKDDGVSLNGKSYNDYFDIASYWYIINDEGYLEETTE